MGLRSRILSVDWGGSPPKRHHKMRAAREVRYKLLVEACQQAGAHHLMTAHHADDQAETFLLRLIHASGLDGLAGMSAVNRMYVPTHGVRILRPLLDIHKEELISLCLEWGLDFATDATNEDPSYQRNRLRQMLQEATIVEASLASSEIAAEIAIAAEVATTTSLLPPPPPPPQKGAFQQNNAESSVHHFVVPQVVQDILTLQKLCSKVSKEQQRQAAGLLRKALLHAAPCTQLTPRSKNTAYRTPPPLQQPGYQTYISRRRHLVHWPSQLTALSRQIQHLRHAIVYVKPFDGAEKTIVAAALSHLLQSVSGSAYPPALSDSMKLAERVSQGKLVGGFTGGGCTVQPVVHSRGRYMLISPQRDQKEVKKLLRAEDSGVSSINSLNNNAMDDTGHPAPEQLSSSSLLMMREASG